jgi:hypothetical protein
MPSMKDILNSIREDFENTSEERLLGQLQFEEDLMELDNPRSYGPDWDEE